MVLGDTEVSSPQTRLSRVQRVGWGRQKALPAPGGGAPPVSQNGHPRTCRKSPNKGPGGKRGRRHKSLQGGEGSRNLRHGQSSAGDHAPAPPSGAADPAASASLWASDFRQALRIRLTTKDGPR